MSSKFVRHYKDLSFDNLKSRHDNFSFGKAITAKLQAYDSIHFVNTTGGDPQPVYFQKLLRKRSSTTLHSRNVTGPKFQT